jgi:cobyrinic acid a,c-diamide synthase
MIDVPRIVIAGTHSGVGKTTIATALMAAYARRGLRVQPFKIGPDFIDPGFHQAACGRVSRNLDGWMLSQVANLEVFARASAGADLAIIEGVMGLFDGRSATAEEGSTAEMAKWLGAPVLLVADASAMARSAAALVHGFETFDDRLDLAGVLFNRIGGARHADLLRESLTAYCRSTPLGFLPRSQKIAVPSRHLGLTLASEAPNAECLAEMVAWVENHIDLDALLAVARKHSPPLTFSGERASPSVANVRIAVAQDAAFCFYYQDNLDLLSEAGAELVDFSPIADRELPPDVHGLYLGGGYPELHAAQLSENRAMIEAIRRFAYSRAPVYAECGGFMYLTEAIVEPDGPEHPMVGIFPTRARMQSRLARLGYVEAQACDAEGWLMPGERARGHEFRYSVIDPMPETIRRVYRDPAEGYLSGGVFGSYIHLHFLSCPSFVGRFVADCARHALKNDKAI